MKKSNRRLLLFFLASFFASCGNPHLIHENTTSNDSVIQKQDPLIAEKANQEVKKSLDVENNQGGNDLNFGKVPKNQEISKEIIITSKDEDSIPISARFEKGEHFFFNGGNFPGTNGNCKNILKNNETCKLDIGFDPNSIGKFEDQLIITTKDGKEFKFPLYGERIEINSKFENSHLVLGNLKREILDFGTLNIGDKSIKTVDIQNNYDQTILVKSISINNEIFKITDKSNCQKEIKSGSCTIEITFEPNQVLEVESVLTITEESGQKLEVIVKGKAISQPIEEKHTHQKRSEDELRLAREKLEQAKKAEKDALDKLKQAEDELAKNKKAELDAEKQRQLEAALKEAATKLEEVLEANRQADLLADKIRKDKEKADAESQYRQCISKNEISLSLAPKTRTILASAVLPYLLTSKNTKQKLGLLYNNESNAKIVNADINVVNDAQVVSTFLTADRIRGEVDDVLLSLDLTKVETDKYNETEMLCLSSFSVKKCSGRLFSLADWLILKNPDFFKIHKYPVTKTYENILSQNINKCGDLDCERLEKTLSLKEILKLSDREMELLKKDKIIHIILTDDTRQTSSPKMIFKTKEAKECSRKLRHQNRED